MSDRKEETVMHTYPCSQAKAINKLVEVIDGNGKIGMKVEMVLVKKRLESIDTSIKEIQISLSNKSEVDLAIEVERRVNTRLEQVKLEEEKRKGKETERKIVKRGEVRAYILVAVAVISLFITLYSNYRSVVKEQRQSSEFIEK